MSNQAWQIASPGKLVLKDLGAIAKPGPNEVLVKIHAISLNYRDIVIIDHSPDYPVLAKDHLVPASDAAGTIEAIGSSASKWKQGDKVVLAPNKWLEGKDVRDFDVTKVLGGGEHDGTLQQYLVIGEQYLIPAPKNLSLEEAATLWTAGVTAWHALVYGEPKFEKGVTVLTQGTGGVSCYAIQIAAAAGATVIATSSSDEKLDIARKLGATHLINYRKTPDWSAEVLKATNDRGVDIVVDVVGGKDLEHSVTSARYGGRVIVVGILSSDINAPIAIGPALLYGAKTISGHLGAGSKSMAADFAQFIEEHDIHPPIAQIFDFKDGNKAVEALRKFSGVGKIVVKV